jgi:hypothetical protein
MANEESLRQVAQSRAPFSAWLGTLILFALFGVIVLAVVGPAPRGDSYEETRAKKRVDNLKALRDEDAKALTTYSWVDKNKGTARIPIDRAMTLSVAELARKKPAPAGPIATPPPQAPSPAPAASASPSAVPSGSPAASAAKPAAVQGVDSANRGQPAAASNPAPAKPGTQPGASATPAASPGGSAKPVASPSAAPASSPTGAVTTS